MDKIKKIAVLGSGNGSNFEAIVNYFSDQQVEIICLSDKKDAYILKRAEKLGVKSEFLPPENQGEYFSQNKFDLVVLAGYMKVLPENVLKLSKFINIHPSLLPAFSGKDAIKRTFLAGVKVSGITIHWVEKEIDKGQIITQYPIFIDNEMRLDDFEKAIHSIEHKLYPVVIEKLLEDKVFDFQDFMRGKNDDNKGGGGCSECKG